MCAAPRTSGRGDVLATPRHHGRQAQDAEELVDQPLDALGVGCARRKLVGKGGVEAARVDQRRHRGLGAPAQAARRHHEQVAPEPALGDGADQGPDASRAPPKDHRRDPVEEHAPTGGKAVLRLGLDHGDKVHVAEAVALAPAEAAGQEQRAQVGVAAQPVGDLSDELRLIHKGQHVAMQSHGQSRERGRAQASASGP